MDRLPKNYTVCEDHFDVDDILTGVHRKKLKYNAVPSLLLPNVRRKDADTQTTSTIDVPTLVETSTQTDYNITLIANVSTQTNPGNHTSLLDTSRKRKKNSLLLGDRKRNKLSENKDGTANELRDTFHKLCDIFLEKDLAEMIKSKST